MTESIREAAELGNAGRPPGLQQSACFAESAGVLYLLAMPTNVTPEYRKAEERFRNARTTEEKIVRLEDMIALLPKHKGTEHLHADLKRRLSKLKDQEERTTRAGGGHEARIERSGAAQIVVIGAPNSGKSSLVASLTNAPIEVGDYPFTTTQMLPGMLDHAGVQIQLVDTPPVTQDFMPVHLFGLIRSADAVLLTLDLSNDSLVEDFRAVVEAFSSRNVRFVQERMNDHDAVYSRVIGTKADAVDAAVRMELFREAEGAQWDTYEFSILDDRRLDDFPAMLFDWLGIVRVYTKAPTEKEPTGRPFALFEGQDVEDLCRHIHQDLAERFHYARMWRGSDTPITVSKTEVLRDGDVLEIHADP